MRLHRTFPRAALGPAGIFFCVRPKQILRGEQAFSATIFRFLPVMKSDAFRQEALRFATGHNND